MKKRKHGSGGFSLVELLIGTILFTVITGVAFSLLVSSLFRYQGESTVTEAFQQANVALDQIVRDVHSAGYPPRSSFSTTVANGDSSVYALPFAWAPSYPATPCTVATVGTVGTCTIPGEYDLILETDLGNGVQWIRYSLVGTTLMRGTAAKKPFKDPVAATSGDSLVPYLENVMNGSDSLPVFTYTVDPLTTGTASDIRQVNVSLIVRSLQPDPQTKQFRTVTLTGQAVRFNPNQ